MSKRGVDELRNKVFTGIVEDVNDEYKRGKIKVRVGRIYDTIPIEDIPWAVAYDQQSSGKSHLVPEIGKTVKIIFPDGDWYHPQYYNSFHYNINLQDKLESLTTDEYTKFSAPFYDDEHQYYIDSKNGMMFDHVKSHLNIRPNGDIRLALRDDKSFMYLGSTDGDQPALMSDHWMIWFDKLVNNLMGAYGGPYLGNLGAPVLANPALLQVLNEYYAIRATFLSTNVWIVDNGEIIEQDRKFDNSQRKDNTSENVTIVPPTKVTGYQPFPKTPSKAPKQDGAPNDIASSTVAEPQDILPSPIDPIYENGKLPLGKLTKSKYLTAGSSNLKSTSAGFDTEAYLIDDAAQALDSWMELYNKSKEPTWPDIIFTDGYRTFERQQGMYSNNPTKAPKPGTSDHGWATCIDMYWGANPNTPSSIDTKNPEISTNVSDKVYYWLKTNGANFGYSNESVRTPGQVDWWSWRYDKETIANATTSTKQQQDRLNQILNK